jgi:hypothetical protein
MLLYANSRLWPVAFAATAAIASKAIFRVRVEGGERHFLNPSNLGITATLLLFHWVGIAPPYMFTENLSGAGDWILPGIIVFSGKFLECPVHRAHSAGAGVAGHIPAAGARARRDLRSVAGARVVPDDRARLLAVHVLHGDRPRHDSGFAARTDRIRRRRCDHVRRAWCLCTSCTASSSP